MYFEALPHMPLGIEPAWWVWLCFAKEVLDSFDIFPGYHLAEYSLKRLTLQLSESWGFRRSEL